MIDRRSLLTAMGAATITLGLPGRSLAQPLPYGGKPRRVVVLGRVSPVSSLRTNWNGKAPA
jgi:monoamine oxidase